MVCLNKVFNGLVIAFPKREYKNVMETGFIEEPKVEENFIF